MRGHSSEFRAISDPLASTINAEVDFLETELTEEGVLCERELRVHIFD